MSTQDNTTNNRIDKAAEEISDLANRIYINGILNPEFRPKRQFDNIAKFDTDITIEVRAELIRELAHVYDVARVSGALDNYHPGQIAWIENNLREIFAALADES